MKMLPTVTHAVILYVIDKTAARCKFCRAHLDFLTHPQTGILCRVLGRSYLRRLPVQVRKAALTVAESVISSSSCLICIDMDFACNLAHACFISFCACTIRRRRSTGISCLKVGVSLSLVTSGC